MTGRGTLNVLGTNSQHGFIVNLTHFAESHFEFHTLPRFDIE